MNSADDELHKQVAATLKNDFPQDSMQGGPLTFAVMIDKVINLSSKAITAMRDSITSFDVKTLPGENIEILATRFLYALKRLHSNQSLPSDLTETLFKVLKTTSVDKFTRWIEHWELQVEHGLRNQIPYKEILDKAKNYYNTLCISGDWTGVTEQGSAFKSSTEGIVCHGCGKKGVIRPKCPICSAGRTGSPGNKDFGEPRDEDKCSDDPIRYNRVIGNTLLKYCGRCTRKNTTRLGLWNKSHFTDQCNRNTNESGSSAHLATNTTSTPAPSSTDSQTVPGRTMRDALMDAQRTA
jgi:hypothetical protein